MEKKVVLGQSRDNFNIATAALAPSMYTLFTFLL